MTQAIVRYTGIDKRKDVSEKQKAKRRRAGRIRSAKYRDANGMVNKFNIVIGEKA